jgi:P-type Ca2+ transporter type 2C
MVFTVLCFSQLSLALAIRSETNFIFRHGFFSNIPILLAVCFTVVLQAALIYLPPLQRLFSLQPLRVSEFLLCILLSAVVFHAVELEKYIRNRRINRNHA